MNDYQIHRMMEQISDAITMMFICIIICVILAIIVKSYADYFSGLYNLHLKTGFSPRGLCFGKHGLKYTYSPAEREGHVAVISKSGGGKTRSVLIPTLRAWIAENHRRPRHELLTRISGRRRQRPAGTAGFFIDISGDIISAINSSDPSVRIFEPLDPKTLIYDVFGGIRKLPNRIAEVDALISLSYLLIPEDASQDASVYYERTGRQLLQATLISFYFEGMDFLEICRAVASCTASSLLEKLVQLKTPEAIPYFIKYDDLTPQQMSNIYDAVHDALEPFSNPAVAHAFDISRTDAEILTAASVEHYNIFFVIPDNKMQQYSAVVRVVTEQVLDHIAGRPLYSGKRILLALDEFGSFGKLDILSAAEKYRKRRCRIMILFQDINRIDMNYSHAEREALFANVEYVLCLGTSAAETQLFLADRVGRRYLKKKSYNIKTGVTLSEHFDYPIEPYKFGRCRWHLYVIGNNEYLRIRKNFIR